MVSFERIRRRLACIQGHKQAVREQRIDRLIDDARARGEDEDRIFWSIVHDLEVAPMTTNRRQLDEIGFEVPDLACVLELDPRAREAMLWELIHALALIRVYLRGTDHLDDRALLDLMYERVIEEPVPDLPHAVGVRDWIDCSDGVAGGPQAHGGTFDREFRLPRP